MSATTELRLHSTHLMQIYIFEKKTGNDALLAIKWFECSYVTSNKDNCHLLAAADIHEILWVNVAYSKTWESQSEKILGVFIDRNLDSNVYLLVSR